MNTNSAQLSPMVDPNSSGPAARRWYQLILSGDWGLRAGWGLLLYLVLIALSQAIVDGIPQRYGQHHPAFAARLQQAEKASHDLQDRKPGGVLISHGKPIAVVLLLLWIMAKVERRPFAAYGWGRQHRARLRHRISVRLCASILARRCFVGRSSARLRRHSALWSESSSVWSQMVPGILSRGSV